MGLCLLEGFCFWRRILKKLGMQDNDMVLEGNETEDGEVGVDTVSFEQVQQQQKKLVIGYALTSKKKMSFLQPKLEVLARYAFVIS